MRETLPWESVLGEDEMRSFSLQFKGSLHSDQAKNGTRRRSELQDVRRAFHLQLAKAWQLTRSLRHAAQGNFHGLPYRGQSSTNIHYRTPDGQILSGRMDPAWAKTKRHNIDFVPLVVRARDVSLICDLEIRIFWREQRQGGIVREAEEGFDLDSRLKGLLDSLAIPQENQLPSDTASEPSPFLCLLENDNLIRKLTLEAEPLGLPASPDEKSGYVEIDIKVQVDGDELGEDV